MSYSYEKRVTQLTMSYSHCNYRSSVVVCAFPPAQSPLCVPGRALLAPIAEVQPRRWLCPSPSPPAPSGRQPLLSPRPESSGARPASAQLTPAPCAVPSLRLLAPFQPARPPRELPPLVCRTLCLHCRRCNLDCHLRIRPQPSGLLPHHLQVSLRLSELATQILDGAPVLVRSSLRILQYLSRRWGGGEGRGG